MLDLVDRLLDRVTMYRLLLYYLIVLLLAAVGLSLFGVLHYSAAAIIISTLALVSICWVTNKVFAHIFLAPTNTESSLITALILALIITPVSSFNTVYFGFMAAASGLAIASKYVLTINKKHMFNPAAIAVVLTALGAKQSAGWWVGTAALLPFVLVGGLLLVRKIHRTRMVLVFFATALAATALLSFMMHTGVSSVLHKTLTTSSLFFLGFVMLTEPLTAPSTVGKRDWYAVLVGLLWPPQFHILSLYSTPELALIAGNVFSYFISPKIKLFPILKHEIKLTTDSIDFVFNPNRTFSYEPGQYMEWTLPHSGTDRRGNRRFFTLASSPTEPDVRIGVKFSKNGSSFKRALLQLRGLGPIVADNIAGDFTMPKDPQTKLAFIAGGIGVTPFRSMVKYLIDTNERRDINMLYTARTSKSFAYKDVFEAARQQLGIQTAYVVTAEQVTAHAHTHSGRIDAALLTREVADYMERIFYISGPQSMVHDVRKLLIGLGVPVRHIRTDYFSGYAERG